MSDLWADFVTVVNEVVSGYTSIKPEDWKDIYSVGIERLEQKFGKAKVHRWLFNNWEAPKLYCKLIAEGVTSGSKVSK
jgi:hypothetical protein